MKIGRNDPCPCGSGKKYKKCRCGWKAPDVPDQAPPPITDEEALEFGREDMEELDPAKADVMSPEYWDKMSKYLPAGVRKKLNPLIEQMRENAELESRWPQIETAMKAMEAHRAEYEKLAENLPELLQRAEKLFAEERFADMRFRAEDVQRAFESAGFLTGASTERALSAGVVKAIRFLADDNLRKRWAQRLMRALPDYVAAERYLDGWVIRHSAGEMVETRRDAVGPFLVAVFRRAVQEWEKQRDQDDQAMLKELGVTPEELRKMGAEGAEAWLQDMLSNPEKKAAMERFVAERPEFRAMSEQQCRVAEGAAMKLLERKEAAVLLLTSEEVQPWVEVLEKRLRELPKDLVSRVASQSLPSRKDHNALAKVFHGVVVEMAKAVLTPARLGRMESQLRDLGRQFPHERDKEARLGIHWALLSVKTKMETPAAIEDDFFLIALCWMSLHEGMGERDPEDD